MFYADFVLSKKGPLARIWLAAHWDKKLTKAQIFETNIESSIERILKPKVKLALRTSGHLMLGVVRIYSRKTKYLLADCNEAFVKIKMAFRPGMVDLPEDHREAAVNAVTLPEVFHDFDSAIPDLNDVDIEAHFQVNQSRADEITIREDYGAVPALQDGFDLSFDASNAFLGPGFDQSDPSNATGRDAYDQSLQARELLVDEGMDIDQPRDRPSTSDAGGVLDIPRNLDASKVDDFGAVTGGEFLGLFEDPEVRLVDNSSLHIDDAMNVDPMPSTSKMLSPIGSPRNHIGSTHAPLNDDDDDFGDHFIPPSPGGGSSDGSRPPSPIPSAGPSGIPPSIVGGVVDKNAFPLPSDLPDQNAIQADVQAPTEIAVDQNVEAGEASEAIPNTDQTTLLQNEEESFALAPVDASALRGLPKTKRKRKLIVDEVKNISGEEMKAQLSDTSDIVITLDLAPPTKRLMHWKETGGVEKLFALPGKSIPSTALFKNYQRHLTSKAAPNDELADDREPLEPLRDGPEVVDANTPQVVAQPGRRGRKRKQQVVEEELAPIPEETLKKTRTSPQTTDPEEANRLSAIPEESLNAQASDALPHDLNAVNGLPTDVPAPEPSEATVPSWLGENNQPADENLQPASVAPPAVVDESHPPPPYPSHEANERLSETVDQVRAEAPEATPLPSSVFPPFSEANVNASGVSCNQSNDFNSLLATGKDSMMENMGYDGHDVQNQDPNVPPFPFNDNDEMNPITPGINAGGGVTPWHDADYDNPVSVGPPIEEQQRTDETIEQFEERILNKRAGQLYSTIRMRIMTGVETTFNDLIISDSRKQIAQRFYSLLVLKKARVLELTQTEPYGTIKLTKGPNFDEPKL